MAAALSRYPRKTEAFCKNAASQTGRRAVPDILIEISRAGRYNESVVRVPA